MTHAGKPAGDKHATSPSVTVGASVRLDAYAVVMRAVEEGAAMAVSRWSRKGLTPRGLTDEHLASLREHVENEVGNALCEVLRFKP